MMRNLSFYEVLNELLVRPPGKVKAKREKWDNKVKEANAYITLDLDIKDNSIVLNLYYCGAHATYIPSPDDLVANDWIIL